MRGTIVILSAYTPFGMSQRPSQPNANTKDAARIIEAARPAINAQSLGCPLTRTRTRS
jgi:hypothetical protein